MSSIALLALQVEQQVAESSAIAEVPCDALIVMVKVDLYSALSQSLMRCAR